MAEQGQKAIGNNQKQEENQKTKPKSYNKYNQNKQQHANFRTYNLKLQNLKLELSNCAKLSMQLFTVVIMSVTFAKFFQIVTT